MVGFRETTVTEIRLIPALGVLVPLSNSLSPGSPRVAARSYQSYILAGQCGPRGERMEGMPSLSRQQMSRPFLIGPARVLGCV